MKSVGLAGCRYSVDGYVVVSFFRRVEQRSFLFARHVKRSWAVAGKRQLVNCSDVATMRCNVSISCCWWWFRRRRRCCCSQWWDDVCMCASAYNVQNNAAPAKPHTTRRQLYSRLHTVRIGGLKFNVRKDVDLNVEVTRKSPTAECRKSFVNVVTYGTS